MNYKLTMTLALAIGLYGCQQETDQATVAAPAESAPAPAAAELVSGIDRSGFDESVRPQDDLFEYVNGGWINATEMPADKARWGIFDALGEKSQEDVRALVEEVSAATDVEFGSPTQKIRDFYNSYMDAAAATELGIEAIREDLDAIAEIEDMDGVFSSFAWLGVYGVTGPVGMFIFSDMKDPNVNAIYLMQDGLTLPDRDYYLLDDEQFVNGRQLYLEYVADTFELAGYDNGADRAERLMALETRLAEVMWTKEENRDWSKRYNPMDLDGLNELAPEINWSLGFEVGQIPFDSTFLVSQPSYFEAAGKIIADTPLETWKDYLAFQTISNFAPVLGTGFETLSFNFFSKGLRDIAEPEPRWQRAVDAVNANMGELLGQLYVEKHFQAESKRRMDAMIQNLIKAYEASISELEWMSEPTRQQALDKLHKFTPKVGYPDKWIDYSKLEVVEDDLVANVKSGATFAYNREIDKLDKPVDKTEWGMTPQTV
ncbi:MAG: M13 family metallopeptidase, partial [Lysobacterales bacterium]